MQKTVQQSLQETYIEEQSAFQTSQSLQQLDDYQKEREEKLDVIRKRVVSNGIDLDEFLQTLAAQKGKFIIFN